MNKVKDMYSYSKINNVKLLSDYNANFWNHYKTNYTYYDKMFMKLFKSFYYYDQEDEELISSTVNEFVDNVYLWLLMNDKKYTELYRIEVLDDTNYSLLDNYDMYEDYSKSNDIQGSAMYGQRTDVDNLQVGNQNTSDVNKVTAFNSNTENTKNTVTSSNGTRNDIDQFTKGQQNDTIHNTDDETYNGHRHGNIGVMTQSDVLDKFTNYWNRYNSFMMKVFKDISEQMLLI